MQNQNQISQNVFSLLLGKSFELIITFISITLIARYLGVEKYGLFTSLVAITYIISKVTDFGLAPIVFRERAEIVSNDYLLNTALTLRIIFFLVILIIFNFVAPLSHLTKMEIIYSDILLLNIILSAKYMNFRELLEIEFKVNHNMIFVMAANSIDSLLLLLFVILIPLVNGNIEYLIWGYVISNLPGFLGLVIYLKKRYNLELKFGLSQGMWLIKEAFPLYGAVLFTALFQQADILFLRSLDSTHSVGIYAAASRLTTPLGIVPIAIITTLFPIIVQNKEVNADKINRINILIFKTFFMFAFIVSVIISFKAKKVIALIFGDMYIEAAVPLIILLWSYIFVFFNTYSINLLTAYNLQKFNFFFTLILVVTNIVLLVIIVPITSSTGAAIAKFIASLLGVAFFIVILKKFRIHYNFFSFRVFVWSISSILVIFILSYLPIYLYLLIALITVIFFILKLKFFTEGELEILLKIFGQKSWIGKILIK